MLLRGWSVLMEHAVNSGARDTMSCGDLADALPVLTIADDGCAIEIKRPASDVSTLELGAPHTGAHPLDDQVAFEFRDGADDDYDGSAQRPSGIELFAEADELDVEPVEFVEDLEEVLHRPGDSIGCPHQDNIEA